MAGKQPRLPAVRKISPDVDASAIPQQDMIPPTFGKWNLKFPGFY